MNRIITHFHRKPQKNLAIYFTAGYPEINSTSSVISQLDQSGADLIEIGLPFSDPLADGPVIQHSGKIALDNGLTSAILFEQLKSVRTLTDKPLLIMGYLNPFLQFGPEAFLQNMESCGLDGLILPDLPPEIFEKTFQKIFQRYNICPVFLVTPETSESRIRYIDRLSKGFIYAVSSSSTTGSTGGIGQNALSYLGKLKAMSLNNPVLTGFGISTFTDLQQIWAHCQGGIVGSALIKNIDKNKADLGIPAFIQKLIQQSDDTSTQ